ncbi:spore coat protein T domain protein [Dictyocaulus viviparus]|uniref:Spore coat protein T domain protein n=1 Tax=Dictyocaulus viviparus TaxID=29172 RepID=A0A0D8XAF2_DICVI|nr:spore coat protein T domain protein [Dictyocaulus viviparus]
MMPALALALAFSFCAIVTNAYQDYPMWEQFYPIQPYSGQASSYPPSTVYLPPSYNNDPYSNVGPGRDHGSFHDVYYGPHQSFPFPTFSSMYPIQFGGSGFYGYPYGPSLLSNPFYTRRFKHRRHHRRHSENDNNDSDDSRDLA